MIPFLHDLFIAGTFTRWWDEFAVDGVVSSWVQIDITSAYTASCNGFVEVEVYTGHGSSKY